MLNPMTDFVQNELLPIIERGYTNPRQRAMAVENVERALARYNSGMGYSLAETYVDACNAQAERMKRHK